MSRLRFFASCFLLLAVAGCACEMSNLRDRHAAFLNHMNGRIGSQIYGANGGDGYDKLVQSGDYEVIKLNGVDVFRPTNKSGIGVEPFGPDGNKGACKAVVLFSVDSLKVRGWEYVAGSNPQKCVIPKKSCAW